MNWGSSNVGASGEKSSIRLICEAAIDNNHVGNFNSSLALDKANHLNYGALPY